MNEEKERLLEAAGWHKNRIGAWEHPITQQLYPPRVAWMVLSGERCLGCGLPVHLGHCSLLDLSHEERELL